MAEQAKELQSLEVKDGALKVAPEAVQSSKGTAEPPDIRDWHITLLREEIMRLQKRLEAQQKLNITYLKALNRAKGRVKVC